MKMLATKMPHVHRAGWTDANGKELNTHYLDSVRFEQNIPKQIRIQQMTVSKFRL